MEKRLKISSIISLILILVSAGWLIFNYIMYELLKPLIINLEPLGNLEKPADFIYIGCLAFFLCHISVFLTYIFHLQWFRKIDVFNIMFLVLGIISFLSVFSTITILFDIGKEYEAGFNNTSGEWILLYIFLIINAAFFIMMFIFILSTFRNLKLNKEVKPVKKDDLVFRVAHFVGIVCGLLGLTWIFINLIFNAKYYAMRVKFFGMITFILLLLPYALIVSYWVLIKLGERLSDWYDEKQWKDISRAGLATLLISIVVMLIYFIITFNNLPGSVYGIIWLPFYLFSVLFIFSLTTLYFNNKA